MHGLFIASCEPSSWPVINNNDVCQIDLMNWRWCFRSPGTGYVIEPAAPWLHHPACRPGPAARLPGDQGGPAAPQPGDRPQGPVCNFFHLFFVEKPLPPGCRAARSRPPGSGAAGVYFCKFPNRKYIFIKNRNIKYKNKKTAKSRRGRLTFTMEKARGPAQN